ncbi:GLUG motif-containing protein [Paenibacillus sp. FSL M7-1046]|uniref:GLUG motif-containing protein n=1 Tax=Paenibacillus sp. FSL M7-1046 TaxID=2975315 RepID=UPI0030FCBCD4
MNEKIMKKLSVVIAVIFVTVTMLSSLAWLPSAVKAAGAGTGTAADPYIITTAAQLNNVRNGLSSYYKLGSDINLSSYGNWIPVGNNNSNFRGGFDGNGYTITGLTINRPAESYIGLFGYVSTVGQIRNVHLSGVNIIGYDYTGSLVGYINYGKVENSSASGTMTGYRHVGGLVGKSENSAVVNGSSANVTVQGYANLGGLIGQYASWAPMADNAASGNVTGTGANIGGLIGYLDWGGNVTNSHASGDVRGTNNNSFYLGGLIGSSNSNLIEYSYATGDVFSKDGTHVGGLLGAGGGIIEKSYASGHITVEGGSFPYAGGLVGRFDFGKIINSYANVQITGNAANTLFGGLVGSNSGEIQNSYAAGQVTGNGIGSNGPLVGMDGWKKVTGSYYNSDIAGQIDNGMGEPKTTAELMSAATFSGWDFNSVWLINEGMEYPKLRPYVRSYTVTYEGNGSTTGTVPADSSRYLDNSIVTVLGNDGGLVRDGYTFAGWSMDAAGNGAVYKAGDTFNIGTANAKLYAKWTALTYTIDTLGDQTLAGLTAGYAPGTQETGTITVTRTGTGDLTNLAASLSGADAGNFEIAGPVATTLNDGTPVTTFTVKAKDGLPLGTYNATVTVTADHMAGKTFTVKQVVAKVIIKGDANGDGLITPADALMITQYLTGKIMLTPEQFNALDMNNDGVLNNTDVQKIMAIYLGGAKS